MCTSCRTVSILIVAVHCSPLQAADKPAAHSGPWDVAQLLKTPIKSEWGKEQKLVREVYYDSVPLAGKPTRVFAYYAKPEGDGPFPAMLLVHGGGGKAFPEWAERWAKRGYVALAMDTAGCGPGGQRLADGGPAQLDDQKLRSFTDDDARDMWTYHAVAAVLRGHALLNSMPEVDKDRIGVTGISWGGYLTCIVAGIDDRLKVAVPVYGCGFLADNSHWQSNGDFDKLAPDARDRWIELFDPSSYLAGVKCPILWVNSTNDRFYPLDSYQKSYRLPQAPTTLSITVNLPHGHYWDKWPVVDAFIDTQLRDAEPLPCVSPIELKTGIARAKYSAGTTPSKADLVYTNDTLLWKDRKWHTLPARIDTASRMVSAELPKSRPLTFFLSVAAGRDVSVTTPHITKD